MCDFTLYYNNHQNAQSFKIISEGISARNDYQIINEYNAFDIDIYLLLDDQEAKTIAFDWDNTVGADPEFFSGLMDDFLKQGFDPVICSLRGPEQENIDEMVAKLNRRDIDIHLTDGVPKLKYMKHHDCRVNLWIDDFFPAICKYGNSLLARNNIDY